MDDRERGLAGVRSVPERGAAGAGASGSIRERIPHGARQWLLSRLFAVAGNPPVQVILWNGERYAPPGVAPVARMHVRDPGTLWRLLWEPEFHFGEAYAAGDVEIEGELTAFLCAVYRAMSRRGGGMLRRWARRPHSTSLTRARDNIHAHYDVGNDFYRLWLDREMVYTCAYFPHPEATLEEAQTAKMHHVCRKLRLGPGDTVIEAGCGWGSLALFMARHYGVRVRAYNISREQLAWARERARAENLADRVEFVEDDYRNIRGECDAFVSVGMLEHVGQKYYRALGEVIDSVLRAEGRGLIHTIGRAQPAPMNPWIERRIFPGACPPSLGEMAAIFEPRQFAVLDVENLRLHYARTIGHWLARFENAADPVRSMFDESFVRMWRLYLAGSQAAFLTGELQLYQVVFNRATSNEVPWTREYLYGSGCTAAGPVQAPHWLPAANSGD